MDGAKLVPCEAAFVAAGVSVRHPRRQNLTTTSPATTYLCARPAESPDFVPEGNPTLSAEDEAAAVFQDLAFHYVQSQTRSAVQTIMMDSNGHRYHDVHRFLQQYMARVAGQSADIPPQQVGPRVVPFPALGKLPAVAISSGSDATFSDVWMVPLCRVIQRSFPLIVLVQDDILDARQFMECIMECVDEYHDNSKRDEDWLTELIEEFNTFVQTRWSTSNSAPASPMLCVPRDEDLPEGMQLRRQRNTTKRRANTAAAIKASQDMALPDSDDAFVITGSDSSDESDDDNEFIGQVPRKRRCYDYQKKYRHGRATDRSRARRKYTHVQTEDLLENLRSRMELVKRRQDPCISLMMTFRELLLEELKLRLAAFGGDLHGSIQTFDECIRWVSDRISAYRSFESYSGSTATIGRASSPEFALAQLLHEIMRAFVDVLSSAVIDSTADGILVVRLRRQTEAMLLRHEDVYHLRHFDASQHEEVIRTLEPFPIVCIEHLERFNPRALQDFIDILDHDTILRGTQETSSRMGFILGVSSSASPALRQLGLSTIRRLDIQFYPLDDSKTRAEDILEALIGNYNFPLCFTGDMLRLLVDRHDTSQSLTVFMQVLEYLALRHFRTVQWSFLGHFALDMHRNKPLDQALSRSGAVAKWLRRNSVKLATMRECLSQFSDHRLVDLKRLTSRPGDKTDAWINDFESEMDWFRSQRRTWTSAWKSFRAVCEWFDLRHKGESFTDCMAMALDGTLGRSKKVDWIVMMLQTRPLRVLLCVLDEWRTLTADVDSVETTRDLEELVDLCVYLQEAQLDPETTEMQSSVREEVVGYFLQHIVVLLAPPAANPESARAAVIGWTTLTNTNDARAHVVQSQFEDMETSLCELDDHEFHGSTWAGDVSLAFLYFREHAGLYLNLTDWFLAFVDAVREESAGGDRSSIVEDEDAMNARFVRALSTLRLWGYIKGPDGIRRNAHRYQDHCVEKQVFL